MSQNTIAKLLSPSAKSFFASVWLNSLMLCSQLATAGNLNRSDGELNPARITQIEALLPVEPAGFGRPITDRAFWTKPETRKRVGDVVANAEALLKRTFPAWDDNLYLEFSRNGTRPDGERMIKRRHEWLYPLVLAECVENRGRFLPLLNKVVREYTLEPSWVLPAHDWELKNFRRRKYTVDLASSAFAADLAQTIYWLGDRLDPKVREELKSAINVRIFVPFEFALLDGKDASWLGSTNNSVQNNWNAVCLAGVVGAARTILADRHQRAVFLAAGEHYSRYYINSFSADGYCDEGAGYWAYGFGNYALLRETLIDATGGRLDLFADSKIRSVAEYGVRIQMTGGLAPPFADCRFGTKVNPELVGYCSRTLGVDAGINGLSNPISPEQLTFLFMGETPLAKSSSVMSNEGPAPGLRSYFEAAGVLVCRPAEGSSGLLSAAIKAGGNGSHSHNDIGSFVIAVGDKEIVGDPGGPHAYDGKTFGPHRFDYKILNSFGHPVPVVAGQLQLDATKIHPQVLATNFGHDADEIQIDLTSAYHVPTLKKLVRTMYFSRTGDGLVTVQDAVAFTSPEKFEEAIETLGRYRQTDGNTFEFNFDGRQLSARVQTPAGFELTQEKISELSAPAFTRLGFQLRKPVTNAVVTITFHQ